MYDVDTPALSWRKLIGLVERLPSSALTVQATQPAARWGDTEHLLADVFDAVMGVQWTLAAVNSKRKPKQPRPHPRPTDAPAKRAGAAVPVDRMREILDNWHRLDELGLHAPDTEQVIR